MSQHLSILVTVRLTLCRSKKSEHVRRPPGAKKPNASVRGRWTACETASAIAEAEVVIATVATLIVGRRVTPDPHQDVAGVMMTTSADQPAVPIRGRHLAVTTEHLGAVPHLRTVARPIAHARHQDAAVEAQPRQPRVLDPEDVATQAVSAHPHPTSAVAKTAETTYVLLVVDPHHHPNASDEHLLLQQRPSETEPQIRGQILAHPRHRHRRSRRLPKTSFPGLKLAKKAVSVDSPKR